MEWKKKKKIVSIVYKGSKKRIGIFFSSEGIGFSSKVIVFSSEGIGFSSELIVFSSEAIVFF